ncbi:flavonoid 3'-monooxygenase CYP75B137-like [Apium graveolens]|uniref:flavonoid 3'-monooxygenase CYP75B137-like n=1 Tax=Apium graveolens TaxID=4045 RepID=UPI003D79AA18
MVFVSITYKLSSETHLPYPHSYSAVVNKTALCNNMFQETQTALTDAWSWCLLMIKTNDFAFTLTVTATVLLVISLVTITFTKSKKISPPLPPGPKSLPLVGNLLSLDPDLHTYFASLGKTYGPIVTLWLGHKVGIVINSPVLAREVLKDQDTTFANRDVPAAGYEATYGGKDIVWTPYGPKWRMLRRVCVNEMLSKSTLDSFYDLRRREIRQTMGYFYSRVGLPVDIGEQMFLTSMNVVTSMMWGGTVKGDDRAGLGAEFRLVVNEITQLLGTPNISDFYPGLARFDLQGVRKKMKVSAKKFDDIFEATIKQRQEMDGKEGSKDFLQFLLKLKDNQDAKMPFTITDLKAILMDMVTGGTDTTSNTVEFALAEMMNKPQIIEKVQEELEIVVGKNNVVEESHLPKLPYLYAVMKEILRLHPILPLLVPHCPSETCVVGGYTVPKGSRVFINVWSIHRDPSIWNKPLEFIPERFLDGQLDQSGNDFNFLPFGSGRRMCAGIAMAENMFLFSLASLVHSFDWKLPEGQKLDLSEKFGIVLKKTIPLVLIPTPRLTNPELYQ